MKKYITITILTVILAALACSFAWAEQNRDVVLGDYLLLRVRCAAGGFTIDERVNALQLRANNLLKGGKEYSSVTVKPAGKDFNIYVDNNFFMTVTSADAKANGTTSKKLANIWAERLRTILPQSIPDKPGVGRPDQPGAPGNAK